MILLEVPDVVEDTLVDVVGGGKVDNVEVAPVDVVVLL